jgi:FtsP/CotA-like multicopper oxidase with cupredoxin domain
VNDESSKALAMNRRRLLLAAGTAMMTAAGTGAEGYASPGPNPPASTDPMAAAPDAAAGDTLASRVPVVTPNGRSIRGRWRDGAREFHLIAGEIDHEFAPGTRIKAWGFNGTTPGPTIEAVEGERVRLYVTNRLPEATSIHWHGILVPNGMDGVGGLTQPYIGPGETFVYEFTLNESGSRMYHPHVDENVQLAMGMMGMFVIHPRHPRTGAGARGAVDRDFAVMLHNWAVHPGTYRPDPAVMTDFDLWTINSKVFPATAPLRVRTGDRVRIRVANLSMHDHPMHLHGAHFRVTGTDAGPIPDSAQFAVTTTLVPVGAIADLEFVAALPGDWPFHCHKSHHTMNAMGHELPNPLGVEQHDLESRLRAQLPGFVAMGADGMVEHQDHVAMGHHAGPPNTLPMMAGVGLYGNLGMGGMFTMVQVRDELHAGADPGWYRAPPAALARRVSDDPDFVP